MKTDRKPRILVVYVNYLCCSAIEESIKKLHQHISLFMDIVVVDNSEKPECSRLQLVSSDIHVVHSPKNLGFAGGCNLGVNQSRSDWDYLLLMNPDAYCVNDFLSPMITAMGKDPSWGITAPKIILDTIDEEPWYAGSTMNWWLGGPSHVRDDRFSKAPSPIEVPFATGCCMLIQRFVWETVGPLDDRYFLYYEDADFVEQAKRCGFRIGYLPAVHIIHAESKTTGYQSPLFVYYFARNRILYMKRWAPRLQFFIFLLFVFLIKIPGSWIIFLLARKQFRQALAFNAGTWDGLCEKTGEDESWRNELLS